MSSLLLTAGPNGPVTESASQAASPANFMASAAGAGTGALVVVRIVVKVLALSSTTRGIPVSDCNSLSGGAGWSLGNYDQAGAGQEAATLRIQCNLSTSWQVSDGFTFSPTDVGKVAVIHGFADVASNKLRLFVGGAECGLGQTLGGFTPVAPGGGVSFMIGKWSGGNPSGDYAVLEVSYTPTPLTVQQIDADAQLIMSRRSRLSFSPMPGTTKQWVANDWDGGATWPSRIGGANLTKNGTVALNTESTITWVRNAGRIMASGDSQTVANGLTIKGAEYNAIQQYLDANGIHYVWTGPFNTGWTGGPNPMTNPFHRGVQGESAAEALVGTRVSGNPFHFYYTTYWPRLSPVVYATNDIGRDLVDDATAWARTTALIDDARTVTPWTHFWTRTISIPHNVGTALYYPSLTTFQAYNANLAARAAAYGIDAPNIGEPDYQMVDGLHFLDGATGFGIYSGGAVTGIAIATIGEILKYTWGG